MDDKRKCSNGDPALYPNTNANVSILGKYNKTGGYAMVVFSYGKGNIFLIGTHPEIEEDSDRDGVVFGSELDDRGSDWELMENAVKWCIRK